MKTKKDVNDLIIPKDASPEFILWCVDLHDLAAYMISEGDSEARRIKSQGWGRNRRSGNKRLYEARDAAKAVWLEVVTALRGAGLFETFKAERDKRRAKEARERSLSYDLQPGYYLSIPGEVSLGMLNKLQAQSPEMRERVAKALASALFEMRYGLNEEQLQALTEAFKPYEVRCACCKERLELRWVRWVNDARWCEDCDEKQQEVQESCEKSLSSE